jgi:tRNA (cmo5U34)-methyltransferase
MKNDDHHYPEHLLKDYKTLMEFFPSNLICRPVVIKCIEEWKEKSGVKEPKILEIGPGFGETTELILQAMPCSITLVEVDGTASNALEKKFQDYKENIEVITADAIEWIRTQADESYDIFTASWTVHNFSEDERNKFLPEVYRVLKKGGLFVIFDKILPDDQQEVDKYWQIHLERFKGLDVIGKSDLKKDMLVHEERDAKYPYLWTESNALKELGNLHFLNARFVMRNERDVVLTANK